MNLESFNHLRSKLKDLKYKVDEQYERMAHGGNEWNIEEVGHEIVSPFLEDLGVTRPIEVGDIWLIAPNNNAEIAIERVGLGKEMKKNGLLPWVNGKSIKLGILTDGNEFQFYTDAKNSGQMDVSPYWSFKLTTIKDDDIKVLLSYCKENLEATLSNMASTVWASYFLEQMGKSEPNSLYESIKKSMESLEPAYGTPSMGEVKHSFDMLLSFLAPVPEFLPVSPTSEGPKNKWNRRSYQTSKGQNTQSQSLKGEEQYSCTLESRENLKNCKVVGYRFKDHEKEYVGSFAEAFVDIISILVNDYDLLANHPDVRNSLWFCRVGEEAQNVPWANWKILNNNPDWEVNVCNDNPTKLQHLKDYFSLLNLPLSSLTLFFISRGQ